MNNLNLPDGWKILKISELFDFLSTGSHSRDDMTISTNQDSIYNIHYGDLHTKYNGYVDFDRDKVPALKNNDCRDEMLLQNGDLVVVDASEDYEGVGTAVELKNLKTKKCIAGLHTFAFRDKGKYTADGYRSLLFKNPSTRIKMMQVSTYSKVFGVTKSSISNIKVILPTPAEQQRIVSVLETWDEYLELLDKKIALKEQLKNGLVQRLLTGKIKLSGFSANWHKLSLGEICNISTGKKDVNEGNPNGQYPFFSCSRNSTFSDSYSFDTEAILVAGNGDVGHCKYFSGKFEAYQRTYILSNFTKTTAKYIYPFMQHYFQNFINSQKQMGAMPYIKLDMLKDYQIILPDSVDEQRSIMAIINNASEELSCLHKKKVFVSNQRRFLLNNLISGKIITPENLLTKGVN